MPKSARDVLPPLELLCLSALWSLHEGNVKDVQQIVAQARPLAYTTIMTVLDRLVRKGKITRRKVGRAFVYSPQASRDSMRRAAIRELLEGFFDGSQEQLMVFLQRPEVPVTTAASAPVEADNRIDPVLL
ncbi:MAG: BlaI/MecI/CopY family transcriptional regulator [Acidobacteriia bacterium]|nr:BlaI/MecI/CopY family transcriptional regulator [Terriglobia bacterium]